jgi:phage terminase small subunit
VPMSAVIEQRPDAPPAKREKSPYESLKRRQKRFVEQYVIGCSGAEAMRQCGYKGLHPNAKAGKWLSRPEIRAAIQERTEFYLQDTAARSHKTIGQVVAIAYADPRKVVDPETGKAVPLEKMDPATAAAISSVEVENISIDGETGTRYKYRFWDKPKMLSQLGQWQGLFEAPGAKVNVDARSIHNTAVVQAGLPSVVEWLEGFNRIPQEGSPTPPVQDGSVLPAPVHDGAEGS